MLDRVAWLVLLDVAIGATPLPASAQETLARPPVLMNQATAPRTVEVSLTAAPARLPLLPGGPPTDAFAYNGSVPGPTIEAREDDRHPAGGPVPGLTKGV